MTRELDLIKIGNAVGVILPDDVLERLRLELGGKISLSEAPNGEYSIGATGGDFARVMAVADGIMFEDREILAVLAR